MKKRSEEFELGQFALFLCTTFKLAEKHANLIDSHFARLDDRDPIDLTIGSDNNLCVGNVAWEARCVFPSPDDDMLLCLSLTGGPGFQPLKKPLHKMMETPANRHRMYYTNVNVKTNDGMALEALVSAAMVLASHKGGVGDVAFPAFLGALLFQLGVTRTDEPTALPVVLNKKSGTGTANITVPFLSAPNVEWPLWLLEDWQSLGARLDNLHRTVNETRIDFRIGSGVISGECKDYSDALKIDVTKDILERIPDDSSIHIVVTNKLQDSYFNAEDPSDFITQNCLEHTEFYRVLGPQRFEKLFDLRNHQKKKNQETSARCGRVERRVGEQRETSSRQNRDLYRDR